MASELQLAIKHICQEKNISEGSVIEAIEAALASAYNRDYGNKKTQNIHVRFNPVDMSMYIYDKKEVVSDELLAETEAAEQNDATPNQEDDQKRFNPKTMLTITEARTIQANATIGDILELPLETPAEFGRMAAQNAKQVIIQKLREAERATIFSVFQKKKGELLTGVIQRVEGRIVHVDLVQAIGIIPFSEQSKNDSYRAGSRIKVYVKDVQEGNRGPQIILSRAAPEIVKELFVAEVPEIANGTVEIRAIAREAGSRTKIAVSAHDEKIDPIGSCVGQRGTRVQTIINELGGEKIDIIEYSDDPAMFIAKALAPAKSVSVEINPATQEARVSVPQESLSIAVGKSGQNVRLAGKLTGWKIDIIESEGGSSQTTNLPEESSEEDQPDSHLPEEKAHPESETNQESY